MKPVPSYKDQTCTLRARQDYPKMTTSISKVKGGVVYGDTSWDTYKYGESNLHLSGSDILRYKDH